MRIDMAYVITLNPERESDYHQEFAKLEIDCPLTIFNAVNGAAPKVDFQYSLFDWIIPGHPNTWYSRALKIGELGCALSHLSVLLDAKAKAYRKVLIFEQDFRVMRPLKMVELDIDFRWDLVYLGCNRLGKDRGVIDDNLVVPGYSYNAHAYLLTADGVDGLLNNGLMRCVMPYDEYLSACHSPHPREDLQFISPKLKAIAYVDQVVRQSPGKSTTENGPPLIPLATENLTQLAMNTPQWAEQYLNRALHDQQFDLLCDSLGPELFRFPLFEDRAIGQIKQAVIDGDETLIPQINALIAKFVHPVALHQWKLTGKRWNNEFKVRSKLVFHDQNSDYRDHDPIDADYQIAIDLNDDYEGGGLWFSRQKKWVKPKAGYCTIAPVLTHPSATRPVKVGQSMQILSCCYRPNLYTSKG